MTTAFQSNAFQLDAFQIDYVSGSISATDQLDTAAFVGFFGDVVTGIINTTDAQDTCVISAFIGAVTPTDTHDGFTPEEIRRAKELDKKIAKARQKLFEAQKAQKAIRKQQIRDNVIPPVAKIQQPDLESIKEAKEQALQKVISASAAVNKLENHRKEMFKAIQLRQEQARIMTELAILRAKELDDEESLLALLL